MLGALCHTGGENRDFRWRDSNLAPKIFAEAYNRPGIGMYFALAFLMPRPQTVNLAHKHTAELFSSRFLEQLSSLSTRHSLKSTYKHKQRTQAGKGLHKAFLSQKLSFPGYSSRLLTRHNLKYTFKHKRRK